MPDRPTPRHLNSSRRAAREEMFRRRRRTVSVAAVAVVALVLAVTSRLGGSGSTGNPQSGDSATTTVALTTATAGAKATASASATPSPVAVPKHGAGTFTTVEAPAADVPSQGRTVTYTVQVENGIGADGKALAATAQRTLIDPRGWQTQLPVHFAQLRAADLKAGRKPDIILTFASPDTIDKLCAPLNTNGEVSCANKGRAALNYLRWQVGVIYYPNDLTGYRRYMVNHEVGHLLGFKHRPCPGPGKHAPVMLQQTLHLNGCVRDPWPHRGML